MDCGKRVSLADFCNRSNILVVEFIFAQGNLPISSCKPLPGFTKTKHVYVIPLRIRVFGSTRIRVRPASSVDIWRPVPAPPARIRVCQKSHTSNQNRHFWKIPASTSILGNSRVISIACEFEYVVALGNRYPLIKDDDSRPYSVHVYGGLPSYTGLSVYVYGKQISGSRGPTYTEFPLRESSEPEFSCLIPYTGLIRQFVTELMGTAIRTKLETLKGDGDKCDS